MTVQGFDGLHINSIYRATEGEGACIGRPRFLFEYRCTIGCANCDSKDTWEFGVNLPCRVSDAMEQIWHFQITAKGYRLRGDPLHPKHVSGVLQLVRELKIKNFYFS